MSNGELQVSLRKVTHSRSSIAIDWSNDHRATRVSVVKPQGRGESTLEESSHQPLPTHLVDRHLSPGIHIYIITNWDDSGSSGQVRLPVKLT